MYLFAQRYDEALAAGRKACDVARDANACTTVTAVWKSRGDEEQIEKALRKACAAGDQGSCDEVCGK
jgi:hypothetical protein